VFESVAVTVIGELPFGVEVLVTTLSVEELPGLTGLGLKPAVAPLGNPVAVSVTSLPLNPLTSDTATVNFAVAPAVTARKG
jgi:hypothetical protein